MTEVLRVLMLEDRATDAELEQRELRHAGLEFESLVVSEEADFVRALSEFAPDLILADYGLPRFDGLSALGLALAARPDTPVILVSGTVGEERAIESLKLGATDYVLKQRLDRLGPVALRALREAEARRERHAAQTALAASERRFRALIENSADAITLIAPDGAVIYDSPAAPRLLGYEKDELVGQNALDYIHPDDQAATQQLLNRVLAAPNEPVPGLFRFRHKDGSWRWIEGVASNLLAEPSVRAIALNYRDITERVEAEAELRLQGAALDAAANAIVITDAAGAIAYVNPAFTALTGYAADEVLGHNPRLLNSGQQPAGFYQQMWAAISAGQVWHGELVNRRKDGSLYTEEQTITPVLDAQNRVTHFIAIKQDVTARKEARARISYLATVLENVSDAIVSTDLEMRIVSWNAGAEAMSGYKREEVIGRLYASVLTAEFLEGDETSALEQVAETGRWDGEMRATRKDGTPVYVLAASAVLKDSAGEPTGFSTVLHDITARKQAEAAMAASEAQLRALFAAMTDIVLVLDAEGRYLQIAPTNPELLIKPASEMLGRTVTEVLPAAEAAGTLGAIRQALETRRLVHYEYSLPVGGSVTWFDATVSDLGPERVFFVARDITERKRAEAALRESEDKFRYIFDFSPIGKSITGLHGELLEVNRAFADMVGYSIAELHERAWAAITHPEDLALSQSAANSLLGGQGESSRFIKRYLHKNGSIVWVDVNTALRRDFEGQPQYFISAISNITQRKQRERELEAIAATTRALRSAHTPTEMIPIVLEQVLALLGAPAAAMTFPDAETGELVVALGMGDMAGLTGQRMPPGKGISAQVMATGEPYITPEIASDPYFYHTIWPGRHGPAACVPLVNRDTTLGVLLAAGAALFTAEDVRLLSAIADIAASAIQRAGLHQQTENQVRHLAALREIDNAIMNSTDLRTTLMVVLGHVTRELAVDAADLMLLRRGMNELEYAGGQGFRSKAVEQSRLRLGEGYAGTAALERQVVTVPDLAAAGDKFRRSAVLAGEQFSCLYIVPLLAKGEVMGVLEVLHRAPLHPIRRLAGVPGGAGRTGGHRRGQSRMFSDLQRSNMDMLLAYDTTLEGWSRGAGPARQGDRGPHPARDRDDAGAGAAPWACARPSWCKCGAGRCCTTSARWACPTPSCSSRGRSPMRSGWSCASIPRLRL